MTHRKKVLVGMSGGVDSSVSAALLVAQGFDVEGVFLKVWSEQDVIQPENPTPGVGLSAYSDCPWEEDLADARAVADQLGINLHIKNVQREYFERVVEAMKAGYAAGVTPNPDVLCNSEIKFGLLYDWALANGFDAVATGHYANVRENVKRKAQSAKPNSKPFNQSSQLSTLNSQLLTAADSRKDQTYFLWRVPRERFKHILFPIGHLKKAEIRAEARRLGLPNATKPDSQGICFLGHVNVREWLKRELGTEPGPVVNRAGTLVGQHEGVGLYTIGQRHGVGIFGGGPVYYVVEKRMASNTLIVAERPGAAASELTFGSANWLVDPSTMLGTGEPQTVIDAGGLTARIRHQGERLTCRITNYELRITDQTEPVHDSRFTVHLSRPAFGVAPGQSVVLYQGTRVVGGGIIH